MKTIKFIAASALLACTASTFAHVVLDQPMAMAGSSYRAVFKVAHGCEGLPTTGLAVLIPAGVQGAKPMPKPGWALAVRTDKLAVPYTSHGKTVSEDVTEIRWTAQSKDAALPEAHYDEFILRATLPATAGPLWFKIVQTCDDGSRQSRNEWTQIPPEGVSTKGLKSPAALLQVEPGADPHAHH